MASFRTSADHENGIEPKRGNEKMTTIAGTCLIQLGDAMAHPAELRRRELTDKHA